MDCYDGQGGGELTDEEIARILRSRDRGRMEKLFDWFLEKHDPCIIGTLISIGAQQEDAEDAVSAVLERLGTGGISDRALYDPGRDHSASFLTWFITLAKRSWLKIREKQGRRREVRFDESVWDIRADGEDDHRNAADEAAARIESYIQELDDERDRLIVKHYLANINSPRGLNWGGLVQSLKGTPNAMSETNIRGRFRRLRLRLQARHGGQPHQSGEPPGSLAG